MVASDRPRGGGVILGLFAGFVLPLGLLTRFLDALLRRLGVWRALDSRTADPAQARQNGR